MLILMILLSIVCFTIPVAVATIPFLLNAGQAWPLPNDTVVDIGENKYEQLVPEHSFRATSPDTGSWSGCWILPTDEEIAAVLQVEHEKRFGTGKTLDDLVLVEYYGVGITNEDVDRFFYLADNT